MFAFAVLTADLTAPIRIVVLLFTKASPFLRPNTEISDPSIETPTTVLPTPVVTDATAPSACLMFLNVVN